jgi:hypothetical protein
MLVGGHLHVAGAHHPRVWLWGVNRPSPAIE